MMAHYGGWIEGAITAAVVLGFCAYQYWAVTRSIDADTASAREARHAEGEHELDNGRDEAVH